jgi:hypothetical protein
MRAFIAILVIAGLGGLFLLQKNNQQPESVATQPAMQRVSPSASASASPANQVSEHNWMKRSLDRAHDVANQARKRTKDSQDP